MHTVVSRSTVLAISLDLFKQHMRVSHNHEDTLYVQCIRAATEMIESATNRALVTTQFDYTIPCFSNSIEWDPVSRSPYDFPHSIDLEWGPVVTVDSIKYYDDLDALQTLDAADYRLLIVDDATGYVTRNTDDWPDIYDRPDAVTIRFTCGYTESTITANAKQALLMLASHYAQQREPMIIGTISSELPFTIRTLIASLSVGRYA